MRDDEIAKLLNNDFEALSARFDNDSFARQLKFRLEARKRMRMGVLGLAGLIGAGIAAAQFHRLFDSVSQSALAAEISWFGPGLTSLLTASLIIATAIIATAIVLQREG